MMQSYVKSRDDDEQDSDEALEFYGILLVNAFNLKSLGRTTMIVSDTMTG